VTIGISGWLTEEEDIVRPWHVLGDNCGVFILRWELGALLRLGDSFTAFVRSTAWIVATTQILV